jgi:hypothetical protein
MRHYQDRPVRVPGSPLGKAAPRRGIRAPDRELAPVPPELAELYWVFLCTISNFSLKRIGIECTEKKLHVFNFLNTIVP